MYQDCNQETQFHMPTGTGRNHGGGQRGRWEQETNEEHPLASLMVAAIQLEPIVASYGCGPSAGKSWHVCQRSTI